MIELSEQQSQALRGALGRPVDVVDPGTRRRYVLLSQEQYERARPLLAGAPEEQAPAAEVAAEPLVPEEPPAYEGGAERIRLRDLPTPPEVTEDAQRSCRKYGWSLRPVEEQLKLQYYFGGQEVYYLRTPEGPVIVPIPERHRTTEGLRYVLFTPEERAEACLVAVARWRDTNTEILSG